MAVNTSHDPYIVIGLTGSFGSGCSYIAENIITKLGYRKISLSDVLRSQYSTENKNEPTCRNDLQVFGDNIRENYGAGFLAEQVIEGIRSTQEHAKWIVDSIRNPEEVHVLRRHFPNFFLMGVFADKHIRWDRIRDRYQGDIRTFDIDDQNDSGDSSEQFGQRVSDCFYEADIVVTNNTNYSSVGNVKFQDLKLKINQYVTLLENPLSRRQALRSDEAMMAMAYTISQRSSCIQRKVGAVITDAASTVISSGYNEVPQGETPCADEHQQCYRRKLINDFSNDLNAICPNDRENVLNSFRKHFRVLDKCRSLHAEENAIVSMARHGGTSAISECTLYTTTYPCRLCANKISQLGIKRVVYLEPYPDEEAKVILKNNGVSSEFFEGITYRAYFRIYGDKK